MAHILGVIGSLRDNAHTATLVQYALASAADAGAATEILDLRTVALPLYEANADYSDNRVVSDVLSRVESCDGLIVGSPEYHGCMTGVLKNFFDYLYREIAGKLFGYVIATGGSQGVSCADNLRTAVLYCHGWSLPYNVAAGEREFDSDGTITNAKVLERLRRLGRDIAVYAPLLRAQYQRDLAQPAEAPKGFAHWTA